MTSIWITAWIISVVLAAGVSLFARRSGLGWIESLVFVTAFFPAPLFVAIGGSNSFIYAFDLAVPVVLYLAAARWRWVPLPAKKAALWLVTGVGVVPLLVLIALADRLNVMYSAISLYRLMGAMALMCVLSEATASLEHRAAWLLGAFSWMNVVLALATLLQSQGWINSNVFYNALGETSVDENESMRFITAGLFRGSLGIIGTLGWVAFLAQHNVRGPRSALALTGGIAGTLIIILCGSKTSLLAVLFITAAGCLLFPKVLRRLWAKLTAIGAALVLVAGVYLLRLDTDYFSYTLGVLGLADESMGTLNYRQERWGEAIDFIAREPAVLMGVATPFGQDERGLSYFHNEYVTMLMGGGLWSEAAYLMGLLTIAAASFRRRVGASNGQVFAALTLLCGLAQAVTVNHLLPGIFFVCTTAMMACAYGLGFVRATVQPEIDDTETDFAPQVEPPVGVMRPQPLHD